MHATEYYTDFKQGCISTFADMESYIYVDCEIEKRDFKMRLVWSHLYKNMRVHACVPIHTTQILENVGRGDLWVVRGERVIFLFLVLSLPKFSEFLIFQFIVRQTNKSVFVSKNLKFILTDFDFQPDIIELLCCFSWCGLPWLYQHGGNWESPPPKWQRTGCLFRAALTRGSATVTWVWLRLRGRWRGRKGLQPEKGDIRYALIGGWWPGEAGWGQARRGCLLWLVREHI